jgi:TRAP-type mannitol/chloroaromatic compound transport system substrate-binding protein
MKRREVLAGALALSACSAETPNCGTGDFGEQFNWKMVTTWPPNFPALGTGVVTLAKSIESD